MYCLFFDSKFRIYYWFKKKTFKCMFIVRAIYAYMNSFTRETFCLIVVPLNTMSVFERFYCILIFQLRRSQVIDRVINSSLIIKCVFSKYGCTWTGLIPQFQVKSFYFFILQEEILIFV